MGQPFLSERQARRPPQAWAVQPYLYGPTQPSTTDAQASPQAEAHRRRVRPRQNTLNPAAEPFLPALPPGAPRLPAPSAHSYGARWWLSLDVGAQTPVDAAAAESGAGASASPSDERLAWPRAAPQEPRLAARPRPLNPWAEPYWPPQPPPPAPALRRENKFRLTFRTSTQMREIENLIRLPALAHGLFDDPSR